MLASIDLGVFDLLADAEPEPPMEEFFRGLLADHVAGDEDTLADLEWRIGYLSDFFGARRPSEVTPGLIKRWRRAKLAEAASRRRATAAGKPFRGPRGGVLRGLGPTSINRCLQTLARALDDARDEGWGPGGEIARGTRARVKAEKPQRIFLEADEVRQLLRAAAHVDRWPVPESEELALRIVHLREVEGLAWRVIADAVGRGSSTALWLYRRAHRAAPPGASETLTHLLVGTAVRAGEVGLINLGDVNIAERRIRLAGTKTAAADRMLDLTPMCAHHLGRALATRDGRPLDAPAFPNSHGGRRDRHSVNHTVKRIVRRAAWLAERDGAPLLNPAISAHALRRTYVAIRLSQNTDLAYVQSQIGHTTSHLVLEIYNELKRRDDRAELARAFDTALYGGGCDPPSPLGSNLP